MAGSGAGWSSRRQGAATENLTIDSACSGSSNTLAHSAACAVSMPGCLRAPSTLSLPLTRNSPTRRNASAVSSASAPTRLARIASLAVDFSVALMCSLTADWQDKADTIVDIRADLMTELAVLAERPIYPLAPTERDVADEVDRTLTTSVLGIAQAAHELRDARLHGQASVTMIDLAAQLLHTGMLIAETAVYHGWPALEGDYDR